MNLNDSMDGRWLTPDLLGGDITNPQSLNRYAYALNNPTTLTDPLGLDPCDNNPNPCITVTAPAPPPIPPAEGPGCVADGSEGCIQPPCGELPEVVGCGGIIHVTSYGAPGGVLTQTSAPKPNIITWPQLQQLVAANNRSNRCTQLIDCIVFRESHIGLSGGNPKLTLKNGLGAGFNANATSGPNGTGAKGLMQLESCKNFGPCPPVTYNPFNPAANIQIGSAFLQQKINAFGLTRGVASYGPPKPGDYASRVLDCVKMLNAGNVKGAYGIATKP